jgi:hypothetical protein
MGKVGKASARKPRQKAAPAPVPAPGPGYQSLDFHRKNWLILAAGVLAIILGFLLLRLGDITFAPILLVGGYLGLIPWGLVARPRKGADPPAQVDPQGVVRQ